MLEQASRTAPMRRPLLTSSTVTLCGDRADIAVVPGGVFTEACWNTSASLEHRPYAYSKTLAGREAWAIADRQVRFLRPHRRHLAPMSDPAGAAAVAPPRNRPL